MVDDSQSAKGSAPRRKGGRPPQITGDDALNEKRRRQNESMRKHRRKAAEAGMVVFAKVVHKDDHEKLKALVDPWLAEQAALRSEREAAAFRAKRAAEARKASGEGLRALLGGILPDRP